LRSPFLLLPLGSIETKAILIVFEPTFPQRVLPVQRSLPRFPRIFFPLLAIVFPRRSCQPVVFLFFDGSTEPFSSTTISPHFLSSPFLSSLSPWTPTQYIPWTVHLIFTFDVLGGPPGSCFCPYFLHEPFSIEFHSTGDFSWLFISPF